MTDEDGRLEKAKKLKIDGVVYCLTHGCVHENTLDPYDEGRLSCWDNMWSGERTRAMVHRTVFWGARKGDYPE